MLQLLKCGVLSLSCFISNNIYIKLCNTIVKKSFILLMKISLKFIQLHSHYAFTQCEMVTISSIVGDFRPLLIKKAL